MNYPKLDTFHKRLLWAMQKKGISKKQLSSQIGLAANAISWLIIHKRLPRPENLLNISKVLDVDHLWLSVGSANETPPDFIKLKDRLNWAIKRKGISISRLARQIKMSGSPIRIMLRKDIAPHPSTLLKLSKALEVDYIWLSRGYKKTSIEPILPWERLKHALLNKGYSITQFAKILKVSQPTVSQWVNGAAIPREKTRIKISNLLSQDESWLFDGIIGGHSISFTQRFIYASNKLGVSHNTLAKKLKCTPTTILKYHKGTVPNKSKWDKIAKQLGVEKAWLFREFEPRRKRNTPNLPFNAAMWGRFKLGAKLVGITTDKYLQLFMGWSMIRRDYFNPKRKALQYSTCLSMAVSFGVEIKWLLKGKGEMLIPNGFYPIENFWNTFQERLLYLDWSRPKKNSTKLAKRLGVTVQTIYNYRNLNAEHKPDHSSILLISKYYEVPFTWLSTGTFSNSFYLRERRLILKTFPGLKNNIYNRFKTKSNGHIRVICEKAKWKFKIVS